MAEITAPQAILFDALVERLKLKVPSLRYIEQDLGQLENYEIRPAVTWPCSLIDIDEIKFSEAGNHLIQIGEGIISIRTGMVKYTDSNNLVTAEIRKNALQYYEVDQEVYIALHGWAPPGFSKLIRVYNGKEGREDDIRVRISRFSYVYTDDSAKKATTSVPRPDPKLHGSTKP